MHILKFLKNPSVSSKKYEISDEWWRQIELSQLSVRATLAPRMALTGGAVALALIWSFWDHQHRTIIRSAFIGILTVYVVLSVIAKLWSIDRHRDRHFRQYQLSFSLTAAAVGIGWSVVLIFGLQNANLVQTSTLYALAVGLMSAPAFSGPALYALSLWIPITIGAFIAIAVDAATPPIPSLVGLTGYAFLTFTTILSVNASTIDRELKRIDAEQQKELVNLLLRDFQEGSSDFLWETNAELDLLSPSPRFAQAARTTPDALIGQSIIRFLTDHRARCAGTTNDSVVAALLDLVGQRQPFHEQRVELAFGAESRCWSITGKPIISADGRFTGYRGVASDVTEIHDAERKIDHIARHDNLTGLANRMSFDAALAAICADPGSGAALLCLDLDHFKSVNDRFGHKTGDALLVAAVQRMLRCLRAQDRPFRLGGDEFGIILPETSLANADAIGARIVAHLGEPFRIDAVNLTIGTSVGIAMITAPGQSASDIYHAADLALYRAKAEGRGTHRASTAEPDATANRARDVKFALNNALNLDEFYLDYQPIIRLATGEISAVEALARWRHPQYGILAPDLFIPEAEHSGAIIPIGRHVIAAACAFAATIPAAIAVAINVSAVQLHDASLLETIATCLATHGIAPARLEFELTETAMLDITPQTVAALEGIKALGCGLSLDDFGAGYSSIATLFYFQFDRLKIDRSLIRDAIGESRRRIILRNITRMARDIGIIVTGEGAETEQHRTALIELGFDDVQGNLFSPPLPAAELQRQLREVAWGEQAGQGRF